MKNKSLSRVLALLLALSVVMTLLPAAFAAGMDGVSIQYTVHNTKDAGDTSGWKMVGRDLYLVAGSGSYNITAQAQPTTGTTYTYEWQIARPADDAFTDAGSTVRGQTIMLTVNDSTKTGDGTCTLTVTNETNTNRSWSIYVHVVSSLEEAPDSISVTPGELALNVGEKKQITATLTPAASTVAVTWISQDTNVATVDQDGWVTGEGKGETFITAGVGDLKAECKVTVSDSGTANVSVTSITISGNLSVDVGKTTQLTAAVQPDNATNKTVTWRSSSETVAQVSTNGLVTGKSQGTATITATAADGSGVTATCTVTVTAAPATVNSVTIFPQTTTILQGESARLEAKVDPEGAAAVTWTSSNTNIVTVAQDGTITGVNGGTATITATAGGKSGTCSVTVTAIPVTGLTLNRTTIASLSVGQTSQLEVTYSPANATNKDVEWTSSNANIVSVTDGLVQAKGIGSATITVTSKSNPNAKAQCVVSVSYAPAESIALSQNAVSVKVGEQVAVSATLTPSGADPTNVVWSITGNNEIVSLNTTTGRSVILTGAMAGKAVLTARAVSWGGSGDQGTATCEVTVPGIRPTYKGEELREGQVIELPLNGQITFGTQRYGDAPTGSPVWTSGSTSVAYFTNAASGVLAAQSLGATEVTVTLGSYTATFTVRVVENTANAIPWSMSSNQSLEMSSLFSQLRLVYKEALEATGATNVNASDLYYLTNLTVPTSQGVLYYNYVSSSNHGYGVGATERYYLSPPTGLRGLSDVTFVPNASFSGTAVISYTGFDVNGRSFAGTIRITISGGTDVTYTTGQNTPVTFRGDDFNAAYREQTGRDIRYVTFDLPTSSQGTLYYNYIGTGQYASRVTSTDRFTRTTTPLLDNVTFLPAQDFYGTVRIVYHIIDSGGYSSTGRVTITVSNQSQGAGGDVNYSATRGETVTFSAARFQTVCQQVLNESLDYVYFTPPATSLGTMWYRYSTSSSSSQVLPTTRYYSTNSTTRPGVGGVYFVPTSTTVGTVEIPFTVYSTGGHRFSGKVVIDYSDIGEGELTFTVRAGQPLQFNAPDFNEAILSATGDTFSYITFDRLPTTAQGVLNYNYYSITSTGTRLTTTTRLYRTGTASTSLSRVAFIPSASYVGAVELPFTAYSATGSRLFSGTVIIQVESGSDLIVRYNAYSGRSVVFSAGDFNAACLAATGGNLNYVRFTLPANTQGRLYLNYDPSKTYNTSVGTANSYYRTGNSSQLIDRVSFVAAANYTGTVEFSYIGTSTSGATFRGTVVITVSLPAAQSITFSANSLPLSFTAASFSRAVADVLDNGLSYIQFTNLPTSSQGVLYSSYRATNPSAGTRAVLAGRYYYDGTPSISQLVFVPRAGYTGRVSLNYNAYNAAGERVTGTVNISVTYQTSTTRFRDMGNHSWAIPSVDFLNNAGIIAGVDAGLFAPGESVTRGQFVRMLCLALNLSTGNTVSFTDVPTNAYYSESIATAKDLGLISSSNGMFYPDLPMTREDVILVLYKGLQAVGVEVPYASTSLLSAFKDGSSVSAEARQAVAAMVQMGIIAGNDDGTLAPQNSITRAEAAVILYKILTQ